MAKVGEHSLTFAFLLRRSHRMKRFLNKILGDRGERAACRFLKKRGYRILARQYRTQFGEIDIVAEEGDTVVFVEVKTRSSTEAGRPFEAVGKKKQEQLTRLALAWLKKHVGMQRPARFDVISIIWPKTESRPEIKHFPHAFEATGTGQFFS